MAKASRDPKPKAPDSKNRVRLKAFYAGNLAQNSFSPADSFDFNTASGSRNGFSVMVTSAFPVVNTNVPVSFPMIGLVKSPWMPPFGSKV